MNSNTDIFAGPEAELAALNAELARLADVRRRRDAIASWIAEGRRLLSPSHQSSSASAVTKELDTSPVVEPDRHAREGTKKAAIADGVADLIRAAGGPVPTRDLVTGLRAKGIEIGGADPVDTVSVVLNRSGGRFKSLGRKTGWTLSDMAQK